MEAQLKGKLSDATLNALLSHLGQSTTSTTSQTGTKATATDGIGQKEAATEGLDVDALQHQRNTNAGMFF